MNDPAAQSFEDDDPAAMDAHLAADQDPEIPPDAARLADARSRIDDFETDVPTMGESLLGFDDFQFRCAWETMDEAGRATIEPNTRAKCLARYRKIAPYCGETSDKLRREQERKSKREAVEALSAWTEPLDIFSNVRAPAFRRHDVPRLVADYAEPFARAAGFDFSGVAVACIVAAAGVIPDHVRVLLSSRSSWFESARLWALLVGGPGTGKTPVIRAATRPLVELHRRLVERWERENPDPAAENVAPRPATFTSDCTIEKLAELLRDNPAGLLYLIDEFESWFGSIDAYRQGGGSRDRGEWLRLYDGGPHQVDRVKRGSFWVPNWGCSLLSATTWSTLEKNAGKLPADGLLQRFLPVLLPTTRPEPDPFALQADIKRAEEQFEARLLELHACADVTVRLTEDAFEMFEEEVRANRNLVAALEPSGEALAAHVAKHSALLGRVALTFHAIEHGRNLATDLGADTMRGAVAFMRRVFAHTVALHQRMEAKSSSWPLARDLARSLLADGSAVMNARTASKICRAWRSAEDWKRRQALDTLTTCGWLQPVDPFKRYGDYGAAWDVNPQAKDTFAQIGAEHAARRRALHERLRDTGEAAE